MRLNLEMASELIERVRSNPSVHRIFKQTIATTYRAYAAGDINGIEYQKEYDRTLYKCSMMIN